MHVQDLYIYPVKSLAGISLPGAQALQKGFEFDRRWMLVDEDGKFITQRTEHQLALIQTKITEAGIVIRHKHHMSELTIPFNIPLTRTLEASVWDDQIEAYHINEEFDDWFTKQIKKSCRLIFMPENTIRSVDPRYTVNNENVSFADAFPFLLISQASLNDLNSRLANPVPMNRFRPNIVISGTEPFEEDIWNEIQISDVRFKVAKPCARCVLTTVDQDTAIRNKEPLLTLSKYRSLDNKVLFGQNLLALNEGHIKTGARVEVLSFKTS
ncbi:MOSC domain-containing protein [Desertivirga xinjiangensis]|uniref:MOSC domain-containing protein n=1 Tax=Desertivirga xinjiangensis TaxID=539206 RepID=UPI002108AF36|nr:MOSC N-terminal beta barrel domain-containing protein [Pedobacter xinjiangensis]